MAYSRNLIERAKGKNLAKIIQKIIPITYYSETFLGGSVFAGFCPFHKERTPSFLVASDRFKCFGCGKSGDAITFLMDYSGTKMSFAEAIKYLAQEQEITLPSKRKKSRQSKKQRNLAKHAYRKQKKIYYLKSGKAWFQTMDTLAAKVKRRLGFDFPELRYRNHSRNRSVRDDSQDGDQPF